MRSMVMVAVGLGDGFAYFEAEPGHGEIGEQVFGHALGSGLDQAELASPTTAAMVLVPRP